ncbi:MAG: DNA-3-methyladenine glycosylase [Chloroflexota bacterium]
MLAGPVLAAARRLVGARLVHDAPGRARRVGRLVEVEAYDGPDDRASHARFGRTTRTEAMFGPPGTAYVYLVYGMHDCLNIVTGPLDEPSAVLVRAIEPMEGVEEMRASRLVRALERRRAGATRRGASGRFAPPADIPTARVASGPGLVTAALGIDRSFSGMDLLAPGSSLRLEMAPPEGSQVIVATARVGVAYAGEPWASLPWRLALDGHPSVSRPAARSATRAATSFRGTD